jgi:hypothetical protein
MFPTFDPALFDGWEQALRRMDEEEDHSWHEESSDESWDGEEWPQHDDEEEEDSSGNEEDEGNEAQQQENYNFRVPHAHHDYGEDVKRGRLKRIFAKLSKEGRLDDGTIQGIVDQTDMKEATLRTWRLKLRKDPSWRPYKDRNIHRRALTPDQEEWLANEIRKRFLSQERYCPAKQLTRMAMRIKYGLEGPGMEEDEEEGVPDPEPGDDDADEEEEFPEEEEEGAKAKQEFTAKWRRAFLRRHHLSLRKGRSERRSIPDDDMLATFLSQLQEAVSRYGRSKIFNMDETSVPVTKTSFRTIAERGAESVKIKGRGNPKKNLTVIGTISLDGAKLPPMVICKGKTHKCERQMRLDFAREIARHELYVTHSPKGWVDQTVALQYLSWLRAYCNAHSLRGTFVLIWDVFASHRDAKVKQSAFDKGIQLLYVPAGQTGTYQPLDRRVFGELKRKIDERFDHEHMIDPNVEESTRKSVRYMLDSWASIAADHVRKAWADLV